MAVVAMSFALEFQILRQLAEEICLGAGSLALSEHDQEDGREFVDDLLIVVERVLPLLEQDVAGLMEQDEEEHIARLLLVARCSLELRTDFGAQHHGILAAEGVASAAACESELYVIENEELP